MCAAASESAREFSALAILFYFGQANSAASVQILLAKCQRVDDTSFARQSAKFHFTTRRHMRCLPQPDTRGVCAMPLLLLPLSLTRCDVDVARVRVQSAKVNKKLKCSQGRESYDGLAATTHT